MKLIAGLGNPGSECRFYAGRCPGRKAEYNLLEGEIQCVGGRCVYWRGKNHYRKAPNLYEQQR